MLLSAGNLDVFEVRFGALHRILVESLAVEKC